MKFHLIILFLILCGCHTSVPAGGSKLSPPRSKNIEDPPAGLILKIASATPIAFAGEPVIVSTSITNEGVHKIEFFDCDFPPLTWDVKEMRNGISQPFSQRVKIPIFGSFRGRLLLTGKIIQADFRMDELFDLTSPASYTFTVSPNCMDLSSGQRIPIDVKGSISIVLKQRRN